MKDMQAFLAEIRSEMAELKTDVKWTRKTLDEHNAQTADLAKRVGMSERLLYIGLGIILAASAILPFVLSN